MKTTKSFQYKLLIFFFASIVVPIILLAVAIAVFFQNKISKERLEYSSSALYSISTNLSTYAADLKRMALTPYTFKELMDFYYTVEDGDYSDHADTYKVYNQRYQYIQTLQRLLGASRDDILAITFIPHDSNQQLLLTTTKSQELRETRDFPYENEEWFKDAKNSNGAIIYSISDSLPYIERCGTVFSAIHEVRNVYTRKKIGIIRVDASTRLMDDIFSRVKVSENSAFILIDENQNIIHKVGDIDTSKIKSIEPRDHEYRLEKDIWDIYQEPIEELSWKLMYFSSRNDARQETTVIWIIVGWLSVACILIAFVLFLSNAKKTSNSLNRILNAMERVANGKLDIHIPMESIQQGYFSNKEFSLIAQHINKMMSQLNQYIDREYTYEIERQKAEYRVLQSQVNPHFLYNILNGFVTLNRIGKKQELEDSIIHLTKMFRYTCNNSEATIVKEEFDFCYQYIMLQKMRYDDKIHYVEKLSSKTEQITIPRLILQPLVENVIKHGMDGGDNPITIWIESKLDEHALYLSVKNNGTPIDLDYINRSDCVGLKNIESRLHIFKKESTMEIGITEDGVTSIILKIPLTEEV